MKIVGVTAEKGGVGKTTLATHLAAMLALRGKRVLLVDFDPQAHATLSFNIPKSPALYELLVRDVDIARLVVEPPHETFVPADCALSGRLYLLPGNEETHGIPSHPNMRDVSLFREALEDLAHTLDVVVIDTAPSPGALLSQVYHAADSFLIPAQMESLSIDGLLSTLKAMSRWNIQLLGIAPTMYRERTDLHKHHLKLLQNEAQKHAWQVFHPIPQRTIWGEASANRRMVYMLKSPGKARAEAARLVDAVERRLHG